jgi:hypothetical protein
MLKKSTFFFSLYIITVFAIEWIFTTKKTPQPGNVPKQLVGILVGTTFKNPEK